MNLPRIIHHTEKLDTLCIRLAYTFDRDTRCDEITAAFEAMATDIGKLATRFRPADWASVQTRISELRWAAVKADEARVAMFAHVGSEAALVTSLHGFAACLGYVLADAATAPADIEDDAAMAAVEMRAAE